MPGAIDFDRLRKQAAEDKAAGLTPQQGARRRKWAVLKKIGPLPPRRIRPTVREKHPCTCVHTPKHHRKGGGCRRGCDCQAGIRVAA